MSRRPNAGGGKRNQPRTNVATRARFSTWRPPSKNLTKKFESRRDEKQTPEVQRQSSAVYEARQASYGGQRFDDIERIEISKELLLRLARALQDAPPEPPPPPVPRPPPRSTKDSVAKDSVTADNARDSGLKKAAPDPPKDAKPSSGKKTQRKKTDKVNDTLLSKFVSLGFNEAEVAAVSTTGLCCGQRFNNDEVAFIMNLIRHALGEQLYEIGQNGGNAAGKPTNESLLNEIEALGSIYDSVEVSDTIWLLSAPCVILTVLLLDSVPPTTIKLFIHNSDEYLLESSSSRVYGWVVESGLCPERSRQLSIEANQQLQSMDAPLATCFEFILYVQSRRDEDDIPDAKIKEVPVVMTKQNVTKKIQKPKKKKPVPGPTALAAGSEASDAPTPVKRKQLPSMDSLVNLKLPEYREALMFAMDTGLVGQAARDKAKADLEFVLPTSTLVAIAKEEKLQELIRNRAFKLSTFGTRGEIACCKILVQETKLSKPKCKAWLQKAAETLEAADEAHARDEHSMTIKWVEEAMRLLNEKEKNATEKKKLKMVERQDEKDSGVDKKQSIDAVIRNAIANIDVSGDGPRRGEKGPTIRASYELVAQAQKGTSYVAANSNESMLLDDVSPEPVDSMNYSSFLPPNSVMDTDSTVEVVPCSLVNDEIVNKRLIEGLNAKRATRKYQDILAKREKLPAFKMRDTVVSSVARHRVAVISGDTGCGKTTQVPQMVFDDFVDRGQGSVCSIIVTQPRRISAISVAERIAQERSERVGQTAGYNIRLESKRSDDTKILLVTTGILLRRLLVDRSLSDVTHIFVDEVHERDINTDFLLIVLKQLLDMRPDLKVILMSATLNASLFETYFKSYGSIAIHIPGRTFPVSSYFLEDALEHTGFDVSCARNPDILQRSGGKGKGKGSSKSGGDDSKLYCGLLTEKDYISRRMVSINGMRTQRKYSPMVLSGLEMLNESVVNVELIVALVIRIMSRDEHGALLIFVPGFADIKNIIESLLQEPMSSKMTVLPLHSSLSSHEQSKVFQIPKKGVWKVVVSTNIAETSITIEDVLYVIDTCRTKENRYDEINQISVLEDTWGSKANAGQRRGRAGRVRSGICYHLASTFTFDCLRDYAVPEMLRLGLEELTLQILALDLGDPFRFLLSAVSPPTLVSIRHALTYLDSIGAVTLGDSDSPVADPSAGVMEGQYVESFISPLGYHLATLPVNPRIGKLMLYGVLLRCIDPILTIAAFSSVKSPFISSFDCREEADITRKSFLTADSDLLTMLNAYNTWFEIANSGPGSARAAETFCSRNYLSSMNLKQIQQIRGQFIELLRGIGFIGADVKMSNVKDCNSNLNGGNIRFIKCALCAGMTPNIAVSMGSGKKPQLPGKGGPAAVISVKKKICELSFSCASQGTLYLHPSSVMADAAIDTFRNSYFMYLDAVRTSKVYARDFTKMDPLTLSLFGGKTRLLHGGRLLELNGCVFFRSDPQVLQCVLFLRELMDRVFLEKVLNPQMVDDENPHVNQMHDCIELIFSPFQ